MKKLLNVVLLSAVAVIIAGMALEQGVKVYNHLVYGDSTKTWYVSSADATCIQTLDPYAQYMYCFRGDLIKDTK